LSKENRDWLKTLEELKMYLEITLLLIMRVEASIQIAGLNLLFRPSKECHIISLKVKMDQEVSWQTLKWYWVTKI